jgi:transposase
MGRPSLAPGQYFRLLLVGYFEGIDSERGIAWRAADSLAVRSFVRLALNEAAPDHSTISRTRRLVDLETHRDVFTWVQQRLVDAELLKGKTIAIDATTLEANAAMRSIVRRDTGETYQEFLTQLAQASGIATPTREELARLDRKRKKKTSNKDWTNPFDPDAKVAKMKDGRTHLRSRCRALTKATRRRSSRLRLPPPSRAKRRRRMSTSRRNWKRSSATRGITAIRPWWTSTPWAFGRTSRSRTGGAAIGRRSRRPKGPCTAIVDGFAAPAVAV